MVSSEGLLWYIFPVELLVGLFLANFFFPAKKAQDDRMPIDRGGVQQVRFPPIFSIFFDSCENKDRSSEYPKKATDHGLMGAQF
jgi:hypothetical protein